jgi:diguanylate cyclase (GGDEF)-like protein
MVRRYTLEQQTNNDQGQLSVKEKVISEQLRLLETNLFVSVPLSFVCASIVFASLHQPQVDFFVISWFAAVIGVSLFRLIGVYFYRRSPQKSKLHFSIFMIGVALSAILWGIVNSVLMPQDELRQMVIIVVTAGLTAGGVQTLSADVRTSLIYLCLMVVPLCVWLLWHGEVLLGLAALTYLAFMMVACIRSYKLLAKALSLQYENQELIEKISISNANLLDYSKNLYEQSIRDPLTGLVNRRCLDVTLPRELERAIREKQTLCVAMLDLDFFKNFNDNNGHAAGDEVLKFVAQLIRDTFRASDITCRYGGEEFLIVLINTDMDSSHARLEHFRRLVKEGKVLFQGQPLPPMTVSIGVVEGPKPGVSAEEMIRAADTALYAAKAAGRDRINFAPAVVEAAS